MLTVKLPQLGQGLEPESKPSFTKITDGFHQLPKAISDSLKPGTNYLGSKVEMVVRDRPEVLISYRVGESNSALHNLTEDFVIISTSAKATGLITFTPPVSLDKVDAPHSVHYTTATKVVLACSESFCERHGIRGGVSITHQPLRYIYYPSHSLPSGKGVLLASSIVDDDPLFFISLKHDQVVDIGLEDLAAVHQTPKEELRRMCLSSALRQRPLDPLVMGAFPECTPYQCEDCLQRLFQPEGRIHLAGGAHLPAPRVDRHCHQVWPPRSEEHPGWCGRGSQRREKTFANTQKRV
ncbi:hypothetical protein HJG60_010963 [Phyllostomus discolor]|uniref:Amine oxidase domain-containing protein n=1 Tax=Phyllostomus discolor TaxID=89673 RepID=A0A834AHS9_9CHIR|nr:hypothetical protein HJG60_010963 [Phyllostomus discolor]